MVAEFGYDGKGQIHVANSNELREAFIKSNYAPCILEKKLPLEIEVSVITARSISGNHVFFPMFLIENQQKTVLFLLFSLFLIEKHTKNCAFSAFYRFFGTIGVCGVGGGRSSQLL